MCPLINTHLQNIYTYTKDNVSMLKVIKINLDKNRYLNYIEQPKYSCTCKRQ